MGDLSSNFSSREFRCPCGCGYDDVSIDLVLALQKLRGNVGVPITITSGCRCKKKNSATPNAANNSKHVTGEAADIIIRGYTVKEMYWAALRIPEFVQGGIGVYPQDGIIHVDVRKTKAARWGFVDGEYTTLLDAFKKAEEK